MELTACPFCTGTNCRIEPSSESRGFFVKCNQGYTCIVDDSIIMRSPAIAKRLFNMILWTLLRTPTGKSKRYYRFFYEEETVGEPIETSATINIANSMKDYPRDFLGKMDAALLNISIKHEVFGEAFGSGFDDYCLLFCESECISQEIDAVYSFLLEMGYLHKDESKLTYCISADGWKKISELKKENEEINQGFIAMDFGAEAKYIGEIFKRVLRECGYVPKRIDEKEHNNQIVPEIFFEIRRSKVVLVDVTHPNYGAYYEIGYAEACGKQVIVCCKEGAFTSENKSDRPHFDISQKSMIVWKDENDLQNRLKRRIAATVGMK